MPKGVSGNPAGRPAKPEVQELRDALARAKIRYGKGFLDHFVDRAYENDACAIALAKKIIADKVNVDDEGLTSIVRTFLVRADRVQVNVGNVTPDERIGCDPAAADGSEAGETKA